MGRVGGWVTHRAYESPHRDQVCVCLNVLNISKTKYQFVFCENKCLILRNSNPENDEHQKDNKAVPGQECERAR